jgi:hypothetical protein
MPLEPGRTLLVKGRIHRRRKEKRISHEALREALSIFEETGAPLWTERARTCWGGCTGSWASPLGPSWAR